MAVYRKKPVTVDAHQWHGHGDHGQVELWYKRDSRPCEHCGGPMHARGWIATLEGGHIVCPGDWIIQGVKGEFYPCKLDIFEQTYELVED